VAACACSIPQFSSPITTPTSKSSSFEVRIYPHQHFKARVSTPLTPPSTTSESSSGRISKITKKRKSISVSGEAILEIAGPEGLLQIAGQQGAEKGTIAERTTEPSAGAGYAGKGIHLTSAQLSNGNVCMSTGQESGINQFQIKETATHHDSPNLVFNNATLWRQDNCGPGSEAPVPLQPIAQPATLQQLKPCCSGCGSKPVSTVPHNHSQAQPQAPLPFGLPQVPLFHSMSHESMQHMQPIATTIYTYPNGYTTVNNPLTPQELRILQATGAWSSGAAAAWTGLGIGATGDGMDVEYACSCGPGCECLGCAAHPFNTSTVNFVKDMRTMMYSGRHGVPPNRPKVAMEHSTAVNGVSRQSRCCGGGAQQRINTVMANTVSHSYSSPNSPTSLNYGSTYNHQDLEHMPSPHQHISPFHPLQQVRNIGPPQSNDIPIPNSPLFQHIAPPLTNRSPTPQRIARPHHCRPVASSSISSPAYTSGSSPDPTNGEDDTEPEQNTVSPSAYFHIDYPSGLCSESDMGCLCGDDCACIGCMLHGNSMPDIGTALNEPTESEAPTPQNLASGGVSAASGNCCGGGDRIHLNSENKIQAGLVTGSQGRGLPNGATNHNLQHQLSNGQVSSNIHQRPQIHPLLEGIHNQEIVDGQPVYIWV